MATVVTRTPLIIKFILAFPVLFLRAFQLISYKSLEVHWGVDECIQDFTGETEGKRAFE